MIKYVYVDCGYTAQNESKRTKYTKFKEREKTTYNKIAFFVYGVFECVGASLDNFMHMLHTFEIYIGISNLFEKNIM